MNVYDHLVGFENTNPGDPKQRCAGSASGRIASPRSGKTPSGNAQTLMIKSKQREPRPPIVKNGSPVELTTVILESDQEVSGAKVVGAELSSATASHVLMEESALEAVRLCKSSLVAAKCVDVGFRSCDFANAEWRGATLNRVEFVDCKMLGFRLNEARFCDLTFRRCNASLCQFRFSRFQSTIFDECDLREADFEGSDLSGVVFRRCDLRRAHLSGAKLKGTILCSSNIEGVAVNAKDMDGAIIAPEQALFLVQLLGVQVAWDG